ncbi:hypothetical protein OROHE_003710 [Orobanche hederae]
MPSSKPNLSNAIRNNIALFILQQSENNGGKVLRGTFKETAAKWGVSRQTVNIIWGKAKEQIAVGLPVHLCNQEVGLMRPKMVQFDNEVLKGVAFKKRGNMRAVARELKVSKSTVGRWSKLKLFRSHTNAIKSHLTPENMLTRLQFSIQALYVDIPLKLVKFKSMHHIVPIDEKWFNLSRTSEKYYLSLDEEDPYRSCKSKRFITKVMFLCAVSRPIYGEDGSSPKKEQKQGSRHLRNQTNGFITKEVTKRCLIDKVIPAIKAKWPLTESGNIIIQQDNARPHIQDSDPEFRVAAESDGFNIHLVCQPPNSPDLNVNDLGWFRALQSLQVETASYNVDELVEAVATSFLNLQHTKLNNVFLSLQNVMVEIMKVRGHNNYSLPHMKKATLIKEGRLPIDLEVNPQLVQECVEYLVQAGMGAQVDRLRANLQLLS